MELKVMNAEEFKKMFKAGADRLMQNVDLVNSLNVFPVPDGDTGTNMNMTFQSGVAKMQASNSQKVNELALNLSKGLLMGARGNSGVILSQIFRGFYQAIKDEETLDHHSFTAAFLGGVEAAYKAVMKPVEGTILTVARESALRGQKKAESSDDLIEIMRSIVKGAQEALDKTPELLPVLKQVGVVDSGGKGLLCIYEGFLMALTGEVLEEEDSQAHPTDHAHAMFEEINEHPLSMDEITYGYCTEIMVRIGQGETVIKDFDYDDFRQVLSTKGDSLLVVADDEIVKVHIHTENPGLIMQLGQEFGELIKIKVDNMREQVRGLEGQEEALKEAKGQALPQEEQEYAIIAVASGQGLKDLFQSIGVSEVLTGGQTMNPSTEDFVKAIERAHARNIILLPNNKNIVMAAQQAAEVSSVPTVVVPTKSITQGMASLLMFNPEQSIEGNQEAMSDYAATVDYGQITNAIRDTQIDDVMIKENDYMGLLNGDIVLAHPDLSHTLRELIEQMVYEDSELVTVIVGEDGDEAMVEAVEDQISAKYPDLEFEVLQGDQPVYHYFISVD